MWTFFSVMVARIRGFLRPSDLDRDFAQELASHLSMAEEAKIRQGMTPEQARRSARVELGGVTQLREAGREARGLPWLDSFWLDVKLGLRMLRKSWGLTLVGGLAMTVAIGIGAMVFAFLDIAFSGALPLDEGDRVVAIQTWDDRANQPNTTSLPDFERWRDQLRSVKDVGTFQEIERNLIIATGLSGGNLAESVPIAEMTASGFQLARVPPLLGRPLAPEDELHTASPVVVIGHDAWQSRFSADPEILGQTVRLGDTVHTVVGVMPEGFGFPVNHQFWTPHRPDRSHSARDTGAVKVVFARLAPGVTLEGAQAELTTLGLLPPTTATGNEEQLHPRVVPYTTAFISNEDPWMTRLVLFFVALLLIPPCANIAILVYARTVTRQEEFAARYVLGASRGRIVVQIFVEVLVLAAGAAVLGLALVGEFARQLRSANPEAPFWVDITISFRTILFAASLAMLAAVIAGALPALKATGRQMQSGLRSLGSRTGLQLGTTWTVLVVAQVAFSAAALPSAVEMTWGTIRTGVLGPGFAAEEYLTANIALDGDIALDGEIPDASRFDALQTELIRLLSAEPDVSGVTMATAVPGEEPWTRVEVEGTPVQKAGIFESNNLVRSNKVDDAFFDVFDVPVLIGRTFDAGDLESTRNLAIVNRTFAEQLLGDANPLGRRVRYIRRNQDDMAASGATEPETWYEIIGVVADRPAHASRGTLYHPRAPGQDHAASLTLRVQSTSTNVADRLRQISMALDPTLRVEEVLPLDAIYRENAVGNNLGASALVMATLSVLLLSAAGIYALMSFTVNQRRREIGIRAALGAQPSRLLAGIFRRALRQLAIGAGGGVLVALLLGYYLPIEVVGGWNVPGVVPVAAVLMMVLGLLATAGPARRGLRVEPTEALREG